MDCTHRTTTPGFPSDWRQAVPTIARSQSDFFTVAIRRLHPDTGCCYRSAKTANAATPAITTLDQNIVAKQVAGSHRPRRSKVESHKDFGRSPACSAFGRRQPISAGTTLDNHILRNQRAVRGRIRSARHINAFHDTTRPAFEFAGSSIRRPAAAGKKLQAGIVVRNLYVFQLPARRSESSVSRLDRIGHADDIAILDRRTSLSRRLSKRNGTLSAENLHHRIAAHGAIGKKIKTPAVRRRSRIDPINVSADRDLFDVAATKHAPKNAAAAHFQ